MVINLLGSWILFNIKSHDLLAYSDKVFDIFLKSSDHHAEVVPPDVSSSLGIVIAVIKLIQNVNLFFQIGSKGLDVFPPAFNAILCLSVFSSQTKKDKVIKITYSSL